MKILLVDNGSIEAAAHESLRSAAAAIGYRAQAPVEAVSWKHSNRIAPGALERGAAATLSPWIRGQVAAGEREFVIVPFFISPQGAIGSALRRDLDALSLETGGFTYAITEGLSTAGVLDRVIFDRVRETIAARGLQRPAVIVVDHGGPSRASAQIRDWVAGQVRESLAGLAGPVRAASMESPDGPEYDFNRPLFSELLREAGFSSGDVVVAPLFLSPGRHAGKGGDLETMAGEAAAREPGLRCHFTALVGSHPLTLETLAVALTRALRVGTHS